MRVLVYAPFCVAALLIGWYVFAPQPVAERPAVQPSVSLASPATTQSAFRPMLDQPAATPVVASQQGTEVDGVLEVDAHGNLIITEQLRHLFDYFYTTVGELSFEQASDRIRQHLSAHLHQPALDQARGLLDDYIAYKTALVELEQRFPVVADIQALRSRSDAVQRLRASLFSPEAHRAFFAAEEIFDNFTLERLAIVHDDNIPSTDKAAMIEDLREGMPEDMQDLLVPQIHQELTEQTEALQASGADARQIRDLRLSLVGPDATGRLEVLDAQRQRWQQRVAAFSAERETIMQHPGLAEVDRQRAIDDLAAQHFAPNERLRLTSLLEQTAGDEIDRP